MAQHSGEQFSGFKKTLTEIAVEKIAPISARMRELQGDSGAIDKILQQGADKARALTEKHLAEIKDIVGLWRPGSV